jgi:hypothetical protein
VCAPTHACFALGTPGKVMTTGGTGGTEGKLEITLRPIHGFADLRDSSLAPEVRGRLEAVQPVEGHHEVAPSRGVNAFHTLADMGLAKFDLYERSGLKPSLRTMREHVSRCTIKAHYAAPTKREGIAGGGSK